MGLFTKERITFRKPFWIRRFFLFESLILPFVNAFSSFGMRFVRVQRVNQCRNKILPRSAQILFVIGMAVAMLVNAHSSNYEPNQEAVHDPKRLSEHDLLLCEQAQCVMQFQKIAHFSLYLQKSSSYVLTQVKIQPCFLHFFFLSCIKCTQFFTISTQQ